MDEILKSEVIVVVLEREEGVPFKEFSGLFYQVHGHHLKLKNYGFKSLQDLLNGMKDDIKLENISGQQVIKCRQPCQLIVVEPCMDISGHTEAPETCSASSNKCGFQPGSVTLDEFPKKQPSCELYAPAINCHKSRPPAKQNTLQSHDSLTSKDYSTMDSCLTSKQMPSKEIVKMISQKIRSHPTGLRAKKLREYILAHHHIDLELYSQELKYTDMMSMLEHIPVIKIRNTSEKKIIIASYFYNNLSENHHMPSEKVEPLNKVPSFTSRLTPSAKYLAQPDISSHRKKAKKEPSLSIVNPSWGNNPNNAKTSAVSLPEPDYKADHLFTRIIDHKLTASSHEYPTPTLLVDSNSVKQKCLNKTQKPSEELIKLISDILKLFPSGLKVEKLKQHFFCTYRRDLELISQALGYADIPSMLNRVPGVTSVKRDVFIAINILPKPKSVQVKPVKFSEKLLIESLRQFLSGIKVKNLNKLVKKKYKIDLMKYSQENGFTDMVVMLQKIKGITVVDKSVVFASDVYKNCKVTCKNTPTKHPMDSAAGVTKNLHVQKKNPQSGQTVTKPSTTGTSQQISLPICHIPLTSAVINSPQNVQLGIRPDVSYASACAKNLRMDQNNLNGLQCPPSFNVQKAQTVKALHPNHKEVPKGVLPHSDIKANLQLLLKSHANGLSIFQLKKLYHFKFQQPLVRKGLSARKLLMDMKDVAKMKGVGVQMIVLPVLSENDPSTSANISSDSRGQGTAALVAKNAKKEVLTPIQVLRSLTIKNSTETIQQSVPVPPPKHPPFSSEYNFTDLTGKHISITSSEDTSYKQPPNHNHRHPMAEICGKKMVSAVVSQQANNPFALGCQFSKIIESPNPAGFAGNLSDNQWPSLPQKSNILREITQRPKMSDQLLENIPSKELCFRPEGKDNCKETSLQAHQDPCETNVKIDCRPQEPQFSDHSAHPTIQSGFSFVMEETGFPFVSQETNEDKNKPSMEIGWTPVNFTDSAHPALEMSGVDARRNIHATSIQLNQSAQCNVASHIERSPPEASKMSINVSKEQKINNFNSNRKPQQTNMYQVTSGTTGSRFLMPNQKTADSKSQKNPNSYFNKNLDCLLSESATCSFPQNDFTFLQAQGKQSTCATKPMMSTSSKQHWESVISPKNCDFGQRGSLPSPSKLSKSNQSNTRGLNASHESLSLNSKTTTKVETLLLPMEKTLPGVQTTGNVRQISSPVSQIQQNVLIDPSVNIEGSLISHTAPKSKDLGTLKNELSQIRDRVDGTKTPSSSTKKKSTTGHVNAPVKTVTESMQIQAKVLPPHTSSSIEESRFSSRTHHYYSDATEAPGQEKRFSSELYQHISHSLHGITPSLSGFQHAPFDQQDSLDNTPEKSAEMWQTDSGQVCCIL